MLAKDESKNFSGVKGILKREPIKYLFFLKSNLTVQKRTIRIGMMTENGKYVESSIYFVKKDICLWALQRIMTIFYDYYLTSQSEVIYNEDIEDNEIMLMYLNAIRQHLKFPIAKVSLPKMLSRICYFYQNAIQLSSGERPSPNNLQKCKMMYMCKLWKYLVQKRKCPWITEQSDAQLEMNYSKDRANEYRVLRISIFYMYIRAHYRRKNERAKLKKKLRQEQVNNDALSTLSLTDDVFDTENLENNEM